MTIPPVPDPGELTDGVVVVRRYRDDDVASAVEAIRDADIARWTRVPLEPSEGSFRDEFLARHDDWFEQGIEAPLAVVEVRTGELVGSNGFVQFGWDRGFGEIGYWGAASHRGRGYVVRACRLVATWGFEVLGLVRVELRIHPDNAPSHRVAAALGATREGVLRNGARDRSGAPFDTVVYSLIPSDL
ncbi:MAG: GNAT family N-acetyltransferase [Actinobacteria bacterium]|nr:GNAT family N-acetyltransferase [Actinomycetota bacterium]